jgi:hypothetical protein
MQDRFPSPALYRRLKQLWRLSRHYTHSEADDTSFAGEWDSMRRYLRILGIDSGVVVDIAASDGVSQSCTLPLFRNPSWSGLAVEMDPKKFAQLAYVYAGYGNSRLARCRVTPENIVSLLQAYEIPRDFDVLNLDIDSYDLFIVKEMLVHGLRPKLISMEINEKLPPPLYFTVLYDRSHYWQHDHFFGCSLVAAAQTVRPFGYVLASLEYNNAMFVRSDLAQGKIADLPVSKAYDDGYRNKADKNRIFPWNADVERALGMTAQDALAFFAALFEKYQGKFELRVAAGSAPSD